MKDMKASDRWAAMRQLSKDVSTAIYDYCTSRDLKYEEHNAHGLYFDVWIGDRKIMLDASPEDEPRTIRHSGIVVVRDSTDGWDDMPKLGTVLILAEGAAALLDEMLKVKPVA